MQDTDQHGRLISKGSIAYFAAGAALLVLPLAVIVLWGGKDCSAAIGRPGYCVSQQVLKIASEFLPFVMLVGAVLIGYRMKNISDILASEDESSDETRDSS